MYLFELWFSPVVCPGVALLGHMIAISFFLVSLNKYLLRYTEHCTLRIHGQIRFEFVMETLAGVTDT